MRERHAARGCSGTALPRMARPRSGAVRRPRVLTVGLYIVTRILEENFHPSASIEPEREPFLTRFFQKSFWAGPGEGASAEHSRLVAISNAPNTAKECVIWFELCWGLVTLFGALLPELPAQALIRQNKFLFGLRFLMVGQVLVS